MFVNKTGIPDTELAQWPQCVEEDLISQSEEEEDLISQSDKQTLYLQTS